MQLGLLEDELHSATETAADAADVDFDDHDDAEEIDKILRTASTTGKHALATGVTIAIALSSPDPKYYATVLSVRQTKSRLSRRTYAAGVERCS